jgi:hypothetical protein
MDMKGKQRQKKKSNNFTGGEEWLETIINFWKNVTNVRKQKKIKHDTKNNLIPLPQCSEPNQRIHMDLFGPLKTSENGKKSSCAFQMHFPNVQSSLLSLTNMQKL